MEQDLQFGQSQAQSPLLGVSGIEVLSNIVVRAKDSEMERDTLYDTPIDDLVSRYIDELMEHKTLLIGVTGRNAKGKGGVASGLRRVFAKNDRLKNWVRAHRYDFDILTFPYSLAAESSKMPAFKDGSHPVEDPYHRIPMGFEPSSYSFLQTHRIAKWQWKMIEKNLRPRMFNSQKITLGLVESSTMLCRPNGNELPVEVEGEQDLGSSTIFQMFLDSSTRPISRLLCIERDTSNSLYVPDAKKFRDNVFGTDQALSPNQPFDGYDKVVIQTRYGRPLIPLRGERLPSGTEVEVLSLTEFYRNKVQRFMRRTMAPPSAIDRFEQMFSTQVEMLFQTGQIPDVSDRAFYEMIFDRLGIEEGRNGFILNNAAFGGQKTNDLSYFLDSVFLRNDPRLFASI